MSYLEKFKEQIDHYKVYIPNGRYEKWEDIYNYLTDEDITTLPSIHYDDIFSNSVMLHYFIPILSDIERCWNPIDDKMIEILRFFYSNISFRKHDFYNTILNKLSYPINSKEYEIFGFFVNKLRLVGFTNETIWQYLLNKKYYFFRYDNQSKDLRPVIRFIIEHFEEFDKSIPSELKGNISILKTLLIHDISIVDRYLDKFIQPMTTWLEIDELICCKELLANNPSKYEPFILSIIEKSYSNNVGFLYYYLKDYYPEKYLPQSKKIAIKYLESTKLNFSSHHYALDLGASGYYCSSSFDKGLFICNYFEDIIKDLQSEDEAYLKDYTLNCPVIPGELQETLFNLLPAQKAIEIGINVFLKPYVKKPWRYLNGHTRFFELLEIVADDSHYDLLWSYFDKIKAKEVKVLFSRYIAKIYKDNAIPQATELLQSKKADVRQTGALILSLIKTDKALEILNNALETEKNDDARDLMLEGLKGVLTLEPTQEKIKTKVAKAKERGKLEKPIEIWLNEVQMPALFWKDGTKLDIETTRFLLYRMSRAKDIRIDIEAKSILDLLDKTQSQPFANALLKAYFTLGGADAKQKYCLTLGSILGDDDEIDILKRKVNEWVENSRGKMAEYAVKAIALNGSTKALRAVEFFSRKYKNKNKNIGAAANESFTLVAEELGVSPYDLADAIIPDFGFDGLFKEFEVNGETYRAYIGNDFKLAFLNEDNKFFKAIPKATSKEIQEEFKEIGKEIKDIVKSQSSRLEQYLVIQRKWNAEKWQAFFMTNPVMFVYAIRLIWGAFDQKQQLLFTFSVQEDQTLLNEEGDEIELEEGVFIGMVHPISLQETQKNTWVERLADADLESIFPQLTRPVISFREKDKGIKMSKEFQGIEFGGYAFVAKLEKSGWFRGSVVDGGGISSYYKDFSELGITAILMQEGCISVGYLDENAVLGELMFVNNKTVQFGSYMYDEPSKAEDPRLIPFENVPAIIYSEVIADMQFFKDNNAKSRDVALQRLYPLNNSHR